MNIGQKINQFELTDQTVKSFNEIFTDSKLTKYLDTDIVEIGEIHSADFIRNITVNGELKLVNLLREESRNPHISNPIVVLFNSDEELIFNDKTEASNFLKIKNSYLDILRSQGDKYKNFYIEYRDRNEMVD